MKDIGDEIAEDVVLYEIPLKDGSDFKVTYQRVKFYEYVFPDVDIDLQLRSIIGWLDAHPERLTTDKNIKDFIYRWLLRNQEWNSGDNV